MELSIVDRMDYRTKKGFSSLLHFEVTDFAKVLSKDNEADRYFLKEGRENNGYFVINKDGYLGKYNDTNNKSFGIRLSIDRNNNLKDKSSIVYGTYPQSVVGDKLAEELEQRYQNQELLKTNCSYTIDKNRDYGWAFDSKKLNEYFYADNRYVRIDLDHSIKLNNKIYNHNMWFRVEPVNWVVLDNKIVSEKVLLSGISYNDIWGMPKNFRESFLYTYINDYLKKEMFRENEIKIDKEVKNTDTSLSVSKKMNDIKVRIKKLKCN